MILSRRKRDPKAEFPDARFTSGAAKTIRLSDQIALKHHHEYLGSEHLLLALYRDQDASVQESIRLFPGVSRKVRECIREDQGPPLILLTRPNLSRTVEHRLAIETAIGLAGQNPVGSIHLLNGVMNCSCVARNCLDSIYENFQSIADQVRRRLTHDEVFPDTDLDQ